MTATPRRRHRSAAAEPAATAVAPDPNAIEKAPTGIDGLDEILAGGVPRGRPTLICGAAGCGKTVLAMEFLLRGITRYDEPGVFVAFEEVPSDLRTNFASLGYDLAAMERAGRLHMVSIQVEPSDIAEAGAYDLEGLFIRLASAVAAVGARRIALDTVETLFSTFQNQSMVRAELRRLFRWLKDQGLTALVTGERGAATLTRFGLEEYVADCVIALDNAVEGTAAVRRLRVVKYRGSTHGANVYPFLIDDLGMTVMPITSIDFSSRASTERASSGVASLDDLLGGGIFRGSSTLISGTAGSGKSSLSAAFVDAACRRGERVLYFAFEEGSGQIIRNMRSIGYDLEPHVADGRLRLISVRPTRHGIEAHLLAVHRAVEASTPDLVVMDPISSFVSYDSLDAPAMLTRLIDLLKRRAVTSVFTSLTRGSDVFDSSAGFSSVMDTWIVLRDVESGGERNRLIHVLKSRGTDHSNQVREFVLSRAGIRLADVYAGPAGVLVGAARVARELEDRATAEERGDRMAMLERRRRRNIDALDTRIAALRSEHAAVEEDIQAEGEAIHRADDARIAASDAMARYRLGDAQAGVPAARARRPKP